MAMSETQCVFVSRAGFERLKQSHAEVSALLAEKTVEMGRVASEDTDLPENTYFKEIRVDVQFKYPAKLRELRNKIERACLIEESARYQTLPEGQIWLGCKVALWEEGVSEAEEWLILGELEGDVDQMIVSHLSPFGHALLGKKVGDTLTFRGRTLQIRSVIKALG